MVAKLIQVTNEEQKPRTICGHCKEEVLIDIDPFKKDCTKIIKDRCPKCHGELFAGILILSHPSMNGLLSCIQTVIEALNQASQIIGGKRL